jgi:chorismate dehydratase
MSGSRADSPAGATPGARTWRAILTDDGTPTLEHAVHGEACHSRSGAWTQARERYARGCRLQERARTASSGSLRLLDVGTGLGINIAAALEAVAPSGVELLVHGLERDREVLARSSELLDRFPESSRRWMEPVALAIAAALAAPGRSRAGLPFTGPEGARARLFLHVGDARTTIAELARDERFDAVFLDPFSPRLEPDLWQPAFLAAIAARMAGSSWLATYSASLAVRAALVAAGLRVGAGPAVGAKREGTLASPDQEPPPLAPRTARRVHERVLRLAPGDPPGRAR